MGQGINIKSFAFYFSLICENIVNYIDTKLPLPLFQLTLPVNVDSLLLHTFGESSLDFFQGKNANSQIKIQLKNKIIEKMGIISKKDSGFNFELLLFKDFIAN